jgi:hypothetical protein
MSSDTMLAIAGLAIALVAIVIGIGVPFGMDAKKTRGEFRFAISCFVLATAVLIAILGLWEVNTDLKILPRSAVSIICLSGLLYGAFESVRWVRGRHQPEHSTKHDANPQENTAASRSYLVVKLVIDNIDKTSIQFHYLLRNEGPQEIKISHLVYKNPTSTAWEGSMEPERAMIPGGELASNGTVSRSEMPGKLTCMASYSIGGLAGSITSQYEFQVRTIDLQPGKALEATSRGEVIGKELDPQNLIMEAFRQQAVGSLAFWFPEKLSDGTPNNLSISADSTRQITFDPLSRTVHLMMQINGKVSQLQRPLLKPKQGMHFVVVTWDDIGDVHLYVDGKEEDLIQQ